MGIEKSETELTLLGVKQVARILNVSVDFVYSRLKCSVPFVKVGGALRFRKEDIDRYIAMQTIDPVNIQDIRSPISLREVMRDPRIRNAR